jgi:Carboxypeptidase regulatory-like domain/TonB dependent receptor
MSRYLYLPFFIVLVFLCTSIRLRAQGTDLGTIRGTVTDTTGAIIPSANVTVTDVLTGRDRSTQTNGDGYYEMFGLNPGTYKVTITAPGMSKTEITNVLIKGSDSVSANAVLKISAAQESVVVNVESAAIDTEDQTISQTLDNKTVIDLPRDSRNVYSFLYLNPNITQADADGNFKFIGAQSYGASFSLDGQRSNGGIFGQPTQSQPSLEAVGEINILTTDFSAEYAGIANIRVNTKRGGSAYHGSAFYNNKNAALAAWKLDDLNAKAAFVPNATQSTYPNPYFNINDVGGSIGGPIPGLKKTWFFAAYERDWTIDQIKIRDNRAVHPDLYTGDFSQLNDSAKPLVPASITLTPAEIANNTITDDDGNMRFVTIPSRLLNPTVQALINNYFPKVGLTAPINPASGRLLGGYNTILPSRSVTDTGTLRVDHDFGQNDHLYGVYNVSSQPSATAAVAGASAEYTGLGLTQSDRRNHTVSLSYTHSFSPSFINEVRGGFNRQELLLHSNTTLEGFLGSIGFDAADIAAYGAAVGPGELSTFGHMAINFSNTFTTFNNGGRNTFRPLTQNLITFGDTLTWIKGKHAFRMGGDLVRNAAVDGFALNRGNPRGSITYAGTGTNPFTAFLLGLPATSTSNVLQPRPPMDVRNWEHGYFIQDTWKVNSRLTVNLGLRYELITPFTDKNDLIANFDPNFVDPTTGQQGRFVIPSDKTLKFLDTRIVDFGFAFANQYSLGRGTVRADKHDFAPRVGLAYRIGDKSVIRGGYGIYYPTSAAQGIRDPIATNPFNQSVTKRSVAGNPLQGWPGNGVDGISPLSGGKVTAGFGGTPAVNLVPFDIRQPRIHQYNATFEREIGWGNAVRLSYLGSTMHGLIAGKDLNLIAPNDTPFGTNTVDDNGEPNGICDPVNNGDCGLSNEDAARYRFPALGDFLLSYGNYGHAQSNAFQANLEHKYTHGFLFNLSYTYLDQKSTALDTGNSSLGGIAYNPLTPDSDYGIDGYVSKHRVVAYGVVDLPVGRGRRYGASMSRVADFIIGGWQTSFNMFAKSGTGFTPFWICDDCNPLEPGNIGISSVDAVGDFNSEPSYRPVVLSSDFNKHNGDQIFNPAAFGPPPVGSDVFSNSQIAKRNMLWGPGTWGLNLGVHKDFHATERLTLQFGADVNNLFNHPLFSPNADAGGGGGSFALLGDFVIRVDPVTGKLVPIDPAKDVTPNPDFGRLISSFTQEGIDSRRTVRLRLRITF